MIVVAIAVIGGTLMLICGGVIFGLVMTIRNQMEVVDAGMEVDVDNGQWDFYANQAAAKDYMEFVSEGRYAEAIDSVNESLATNPNSAFLHNNKAWLLATCPDESVRDGQLAVEHATKACELTDWDNYAYVDTIAAAYAEAGDFESAAKWQEKAIELAGMSVDHDFHRRLRLFKAGKAYREGVPPFNKSTADEVETAGDTSTPSTEPESIQETTTE